jgi:hypothetical protein
MKDQVDEKADNVKLVNEKIAEAKELDAKLQEK